tara:strand:+ start:2143 stop:2436 length:294 start_codon:yes stop_codon:yes gene_type:complete
MKNNNLYVIQFLLIICIGFMISEKNNVVEGYNGEDKKCRTGIFYYGIFNTVLGIYSLYLSLVINNGFNLIHFLIACIAPYIYVPYAMFYREKMALET